MPARPAFLHRIPEVVAALKPAVVVHELVDPEVLKRCLHLGPGDADQILREARRRLGLSEKELVPRRGLLDLWSQRIDDAGEALGRAVSPELLSRILLIGARGASRILSRSGLRAGDGYVLTPGALREHLEAAFQDDLRILTVGDVARIVGISRRSATNLVRDARGTLHGGSLGLPREDLVGHLVRVYRAHGGHVAFGDLRETLAGRREAFRVVEETSTRESAADKPGEKVDAREGEIRFQVTSVAELLLEVRRYVRKLQDPALRQAVDARLRGLS